MKNYFELRAPFFHIPPVKSLNLTCHLCKLNVLSWAGSRVKLGELTGIEGRLHVSPDVLAPAKNVHGARQKKS